MAHFFNNLYSRHRPNISYVVLVSLAISVILSFNSAVGQVTDINDGVDTMIPGISSKLIEDGGEDELGWGNPEGCPVEIADVSGECNIEGISCQWGKKCCEQPIGKDCLNVEIVCSPDLQCTCLGTWLCAYTEACMFQPCSDWALEMEGIEKMKDEICGTVNDDCMDFDSWMDCNLLFDSCEDVTRISLDSECPKQFGCSSDIQQEQLSDANIPLVEETKTVMADASVNIVASSNNSTMGIMIGFPIVIDEATANNQGIQNDNTFDCGKPDAQCMNQATYDSCLELINDGCLDIVATRKCPPQYLCADKEDEEDEEDEEEEDEENGEEHDINHDTKTNNVAAGISAAHRQNYLMNQYLLLLLPSLYVILWFTMV